MNKYRNIGIAALQVITLLAAGIITFLILAWINYPLKQINALIISQSYTATPPPSTTTPRPSRTPRNTATVTITPSPTLTPMISSAFQVTDMSAVEPSIPGSGISAVIMNDNAISANPDFTNIQWIPSSKIAEQLGREIPEPYYATWGAASVVWKMDVPLQPGIYQIFILDTLYSSAGSLDYTVRLGDTTLNPIIGSTHMVYQSAQGNPPQSDDVWHSIGVYSFDQIGILSVSTQWENREQQSVVAVDRVLVLQLPDSVRTLIDQLPKGSEFAIVDDAYANFDTTQYWQIRTGILSWGNQFQIMINPPINTSVSWTTQDDITVDRYEVLVWIPEINGSADVVYKFKIGTSYIKNDNGEETVTIKQGTNPGGKWLSLGTWTIPSVYGEKVKPTLEMVINSDSVGEVAADAVAFIREPK